MLFKNTLLFLILSFSAFWANAQDFYENLEFIPWKAALSQQTEKSEVQGFLKTAKAKEIQFDQNPQSTFPIRIKRKGEWSLLQPSYDFIEIITDEGELEFEEPLIGYYVFQHKGYSFDFPDTALLGYHSFATLEQKGKKFFYNLNSGDLIEEVWFDAAIPVVEEYEINVEVPVDEYGQTWEVRTEIIEASNFIKLRREGRWALFGVSFIANRQKKELLQLTGFHFGENEEIPEDFYRGYLANWDENYLQWDYDAGLTGPAQEYFKAYPTLDRLTPLSSGKSGQPLFLGHDSVSGLWSVFGEHNVSELKYPNGWEYQGVKIVDGMLQVSKEGKLGFYNYDLSLSLPCEYDEYQSVFLDYMNGCAFRKGDQWELYDCQTFTKLVEGSATTIDGLIDLWLNR